ncbi:hypothetical protein C7974DRAFT_185342 [Boeremia exigua]|uniref:uncharacterized protein n=1 Tax=Boeremia exigua TaxID=749465 RepID=UPI001E8D357A|nr:uncharacterized protein C7974DRAFT_185342 [Boeremia exigua]KAH6629370.1 hypothetical protein C7974DRAFT_185342 [Boeremia exigua]
MCTSTAACLAVSSEQSFCLWCSRHLRDHQSAFVACCKVLLPRAGDPDGHLYATHQGLTWRRIPPLIHPGTSQSSAGLSAVTFRMNNLCMSVNNIPSNKHSHTNNPDPVQRPSYESPGTSDRPRLLTCLCAFRVWGAGSTWSATLASTPPAAALYVRYEARDETR